MARLFNKINGDTVELDFDKDESAKEIYKHEDKLIIESRSGQLILGKVEQDLIMNVMHDVLLQTMDNPLMTESPLTWKD